MRPDSTDDAALENQPDGASPSVPEPGLVLVFAATQPALALLPLSESYREIGRGQGGLEAFPDSKMSRRHALAASRDGWFEVMDLASRNGSAIDGVPFQGTARIGAGGLVRFGQSLFLCCPDLRPFRQLGVRVAQGRVEGPGMQLALRDVAQLGGVSRSLCVLGESGAGKEAVARAFHEAGPHRSGPLVAVNCAAIPEGVAERLIFGTRKGAFSGAVSDSQGYIGAASGGTLFLDEVAELDPLVQGKLLRVIESGELLPLGATLPQRVHFGICAATHCDLRERVQAGKFRADLFFRIGLPQIHIPPLRQRKEEIPWHIAQVVQTVAPEHVPDVSLIEAALLRSWPGNIRELIAQTRSAVLTATVSGSDRVTAAHLSSTAGRVLQAGAAPVAPVPGPAAGFADKFLARPASPPPVQTERAESAAASTASKRTADGKRPEKPHVVSALVKAECNIAAAARVLALQPTQLRRLLVYYEIDLEALRALSKS